MSTKRESVDDQKLDRALASEKDQTKDQNLHFLHWFSGGSE